MQHVRGSHPLKKAALLAIIVAGLITLADQGLPRLGDFRSTSLDSQDITLLIGRGPMRFAYLPEGEAFRTLEFSKGESESYFPVAIANDNHYLMAESNKLGTNIFKREKDGSLTRLTDTDTVKQDLSYDGQSRAFAYTLLPGATVEEVRSATPEIEILYPDAGKTLAIGEGYAPSLLPGGRHVIYARDTLLMAYDIEEGTYIQIRAMTMKPIFGVDPETGSIALYDPRTNSIDRLSLKDGAASTDSSRPQPIAPETLAFVEGRLIAARTLQDAFGRTYLLTDTKSNDVQAIRVTNPPAGELITLYSNHD